MQVNAIPPASAVNRIRHRLYVRYKDAIDRRNRVRFGLDTFLEDWERLSTIPGDVTAPTARTIWLCWLQGYDRAPVLVRHCIESWCRLNPKWNVVVVDEASIARYVELPALSSRTTPNHRANILRLELLARHGGVWVDATTVCRKPLDEWIGRVMNSGFFAFSQPQPTRALASWFLAAEPDSLLVQAWRYWSRIYLGSALAPTSYFQFNHTFDWLLREAPALAALWSKTPRVSARGPHVMQRILDGHLHADAVPDGDALRRIPMLKMSWKKGYTVEAIQEALDRLEAPG